MHTGVLPFWLDTESSDQPWWPSSSETRIRESGLLLRMSQDRGVYVVGMRAEKQGIGTERPSLWQPVHLVPYEDRVVGDTGPGPAVPAAGSSRSGQQEASCREQPGDEQSPQSSPSQSGGPGLAVFSKAGFELCQLVGLQLILCPLPLSAAHGTHTALCSVSGRTSGLPVDRANPSFCLAVEK